MSSVCTTQQCHQVGPHVFHRYHAAMSSSRTTCLPYVPRSNVIKWDHMSSICTTRHYAMSSSGTTCLPYVPRGIMQCHQVGPHVFHMYHAALCNVIKWDHRKYVHAPIQSTPPKLLTTLAYTPTPTLHTSTHNHYWNMASYKILFDFSPETSPWWSVHLNLGPFSNCCSTSLLSAPDVCTCRHEKAERGKVWKANHISQKQNA